MSITSKQGKKYQVIVTYWPSTPGAYKYAAEAPELPGCISDGRTKKEAIANLKEAISLHLNVRKDTQTLYRSNTKKEVVTVEV